MLNVRGSEPLIHDVQRVPHGAVHILTFRSELFDREVSCYIYTPPSYETSSRNFPALYLLHGSVQRESAWTRFGYAERILDNLIAQGEAKEMIVVMPDTGTVDEADQPLRLKDSRDQLGIANTFRLTTGDFYWHNFRRYLAEFVKSL